MRAIKINDLVNRVFFNLIFKPNIDETNNLSQQLYLENIMHVN